MPGLARPTRGRILLALAPCALVTRVASASPLDDPHVGGVGFGGPTSGDLDAVFWNPAALGLLEGSQAMAAGSAQIVRTTVRRAPVDPATGQPGGTRSFPSAAGGATAQPLGWPPGPGGLVAVGTSIGKRVTLAVATYVPFVQVTRFEATPQGEAPTRYHALDVDLRNVALVPALAFRVGSSLRIGAAPGFLFSSGRLVFDHDTAVALGREGLGGDCGGGAPCGAENPAAASRLRLESPSGLFDTSPAFTLAAGVLWRRGPLDLALAYASRPLGRNGTVLIDADRVRVDRPARDLAAAGPLCPPERADGCISGQLSYRLPDVFTAAGGFRPSERVELTASLRWMTFSLHDRMTIRLVGPTGGALRGGGLSDQVVLYRGFRDVYEARFRVARRFGPAGGVRLGAGLRASTSAVPEEAVSPAAVDGFVVEPAAMAELALGGSLRLAAGYALGLMLPVEASASIFDPRAAAACDDAGGDLELPACKTRLAGAARPTAAGSYRQVRHSLSIGLTVAF